MTLRKALSFWDSVAIITAVVIGVGIYRVPAEVAAILRSPPLMLAAWLTGGLICLLGALCFAGLSASLPLTGGSYIYLRESYGRPAAFLYGWAELFAVRAGSIAAISFISSEYLASFLSLPPSSVKPLAIAIVLALSAVNMTGLPHGKRVHNLLTVLNMTALISIVAAAAVSGKGRVQHFYAPAPPSFAAILPAFGAALIPVLWAYGGWHENTFVAEETDGAARTLPRALIAGISVIAALYLAVNAAYIYLIPPDRMAGCTLMGAEIFDMLYGAAGRKLFEAVVVIASLGTINAMIITSSRITYAMAEDHRILALLGRVSGRYGSPYLAILVNAVWVSALVSVGAFGKLLFFSGALVWFFFAFIAAGIFILRRRAASGGIPCRVWAYPATPAVFILACAALFVSTVAFDPVASGAGLCILASGIPVYYISRLMTERRSP